MKNVIIALFAVALLAGCTADAIEDQEIYEVDKTKIKRPGTQGSDMEEVDKTKIQRPGTQGGGS